MVLSENVCGYPRQDVPIQAMIEELLRSMLHEVADINVHHCHQKWNEKKIIDRQMYTVYTSFHGAYYARFAFCAEMDIMKRITEYMLGEKDNSLEDIIESVKEFINILCGHIVGTIFKRTKATARFHIPDFAEGIYVPKGENQNMIVTKYCTNEESQMILCVYDPVVL